MNSLLHELQNNEAILLMYLANELPAQDRAEVEHMLDRDDTLRLELAVIQDAYTGYHQTMRRVDAATPPASATAAARALGDAIRAEEPDATSVDDHEEHRRRIHWIVYPISAAAAIAFGMFLWWQSPYDDTAKPPIVADSNFDPYAERRPFVDNGDRPDSASDMADMQDRQILRMFDPIVPDRGLETQRQLSAINFLDQSLQ